MDELALKWLAAQQHCEFSAAQCRKMMQLHRSPDALLSLSSECARALKFSPLQQRKLRDSHILHSLEQQLATQMATVNATLLCWHSPLYPALLREISDPPALLYTRGNNELLTRPSLAVVGSRRPSRAGESDSEAFSEALSQAGITVVSGLALGVDAAAHRGALKAGGSTIAVLGTGIDLCYPRRNAALYQAIAEQGLLLSEFPIGTPPRAFQFPRRNRIISGISLGVLVVEAAVRSGSLITARQALEQNREVFALPGSIHNPASRGCNALIKQGAKLVETTLDIAEELGGWITTATPNSESVSDAEKRPVARAYLELGYEATPLDILQLRCKQPVSELLTALSELEIAGWVEQQQGGWLRTR